MFLWDSWTCKECFWLICSILESFTTDLSCLNLIWLFLFNLFVFYFVILKERKEGNRKEGRKNELMNVCLATWLTNELPVVPASRGKISFLFSKEWQWVYLQDRPHVKQQLTNKQWTPQLMRVCIFLDGSFCQAGTYCHSMPNKPRGLY